MARKNLARGNKPATQRRQNIIVRRRTWRRFALMLMIVTLAVNAVQYPASGQTDEKGKGARDASVRPKRKSENQSKDKTKGVQSSQASKSARAQAATSAAASSEAASSAPVLASVDFNLVGLAATAGPSTQTIPKNTLAAIQTGMQTLPGSDPAQILAGLNPNYRIRGELTGPSLNQPLVVDAVIGQPLLLPQLSSVGDHVVQNLRIVDTGTEGAPVVGAVFPDSVGVVVIDQVLISEVRVRELSYDEIIQSGININDDSYRYFDFTLGVATTSNVQNVKIPVAFPPVDAADPRPVIGVADAPVGTPVPDIFPVMLKPSIGGGSGSPETPEEETQGGGGISIPGVVVFPGRVGFLQQHFEAIVIVANGSPQGSGLVVKQLKAKITLPNPSDGGPPLAIAETQVGGRVEELELHGLGQDEKYGTADDTNVFPSGASGQAGFLLKGLRQGLHTVNFELNAVLEGLANGPLNISGRVSGAVLVRDASIAVSFTHPAVVRKDQEYDLSMTLFNQSSRDLQGAVAQLSQASISGATLLAEDTGQRSFDTTIKGGGSATVTWRLKSLRTGAVTASYVTINNGATATLGLVTGVGDRGIALSPDSLALPEPVKYLPKGVVEAASAVLGQAWSVATAPPGSLPPGVTPISKSSVYARASELGVAGLRVKFGEPVPVSLDTLMRDWLGELQDSPDPGFADVLRNTPAGYHWYDSVGAYLYQQLSDGTTTPASLLQEFSAAEMPRSPFIYALVTQANGAAAVGASIVDSNGRKVGLGTSVEERAGDLGAGYALRINNAAAQTFGQVLVVSRPTREEWTLELHGWREGPAAATLLIPSGGTTYRQITFNDLSLNAGGRYRIKFRPFTSAPAVLQEFRDGAFRDASATGSEAPVSQPQPRVVGAVQIAPEVLDGGDKYGRLVGVLFSNPMSKDSAETPSRYAIGGGALAHSTEQVGGTIKVTGAKSDFGNRFAFLSLDSPVGPYISRDVTVNGVSDVRSQRVNQSRADIVATVSPQGNPPGAYLTGRVQLADGTPVGNAQLAYWPQPCSDGGTFVPVPAPISVQKTDAQGRYVIDYVRDGDCGPVVISATHPVTGSTKQLTSSVVYDGQHMVLDPVFIARGRAAGAITLGSSPAPLAYVRLLPDLDIVGAQLVQADEDGRYTAGNLPIGHVSVLAIGAGAQGNATGLAVGTIEGAGRTTQINVSLSNISGVINGRVIFGDGAQTPSPGSLVVAFAGFPEVDGGTNIIERSVGYAYTDREGRFTIRNLPVKNINLNARDAAGNSANLQVPLTQTSREVSGVQMTYTTQTFGAVSGRVVGESGSPIANASVRLDEQEVKSDASGAFSFVKVVSGDHTVNATAPDTHMVGYSPVTVRANETASNIQVVVATPATISGHVFIQRNGEAAPSPAVNATVTVDGQKLATTDAQGAYTLNNVAGNQSYIIRFVHSDGNLAVNQPLVVASGESLVRNATLRPSSVRGRIFQPDGTTGTVAQVMLSTLKPDPQGLLQQKSVATQSLPDGSYRFDNLNPGAFRVTAYNTFFPTLVSKGGTLGANDEQECDLKLVAALTGKIQGRVFQPDGKPAGAGVQVALSSSSFPELVVPTDAMGRYEFAEVVPTGSYTLTATDPATNRTNRRYVSVKTNTDAMFDITLLGHGNLRVQVLDASGNAPHSGSIRITGTDYPNEERFATIDSGNGGLFEFNNLPQGSYAVSATSQGRSGRVAVTLVRNALSDITVRLEPSGTIKGHVKMPGGTVGAGLADVSLVINDRIVGVVTTSDVEGDVGAFSFANVPATPFTLEAFDNRTGRRGRSTGRIFQQGETAVVDIQLVPVGAVAGRVTSNGAAVEHATVNIQTHGGLQYVNLQATTDDDGRYRFTGIPVGSFTVNVVNGPGGLTGQAQGEVTGTAEPLPDTVADIALQPSITLVGTIQRHDGSGPLAGARVVAFSDLGAATATTDEQGKYRFEFFPNRDGIRIRALAPSGYDRAEVVLADGLEPGATVTTDLQLAGVGAVTGRATDHLGNPLSAGTVTLVNNQWDVNNPVNIVAPVLSDGQYRIDGAPAGDFTLTLIAADHSRAGIANGTILADQTIDLPISLQDAGTVTGTVKDEAGRPVAGLDVTLYVTRQGSSSVDFSRFAHTNAEGVFTFAVVPLGALNLQLFDPAANNTTTIPGRSLQTNNETLDYGVITLDTLPPTVESITPADGAANVSPGTAITVRFSEPVRQDTAHEGTIKILGGSAHLTARAFLSEDKREVTLRSDPYAYFPVWLSDTNTYTVVVTTQVKDLANHQLASEVRATFTTGDETGPVVTGSVPTDGAFEVPITTPIRVSFNEPIDPTQIEGVVTLSAWNPEQNWWGGGWDFLESVPTLSEDRKSVSVVPSAPLVDGTRYLLQVSGQKDDSGNYGYNYFSAEFVTVDRVAPQIETWKVGFNSAELDGLITARKQPYMQIHFRDGASGVDEAAAVVTLDGVRLTDGLTVYSTDAYYIPQAPLAPGPHTINIKVVDRSGNSAEKAASFTIDDGAAVTSVVPAAGSQHGGTRIRINGSGLENSDQTRPQVFVGGNEATLDRFYYGSDCDFGKCVDVTTPAGTPGPATVEVRTDHGTATLANGFTYEVDPRTPFVVEPDTLLLWHLDEQIDAGECQMSPDAGPYHINVSCYGIGELTEGRFKKGANASNFTSGRYGNDNDTEGRLVFTDGGFTLEGWFKINPETTPIEQDYTLIGRRNRFEPALDYGLRMLTSGAVQAQLFNQNGDAWETTLEPSAYPVNDNQWHSLAMVVERGAAAAQNRLVIYVDGEERASSLAPAGFGAIRKSDDFRFGSQFAGMTDELRVSGTAHTAEVIRQTYENNVLRMGVITPRAIERGVATEVSVTGYKLDDVSVALKTTDGGPIPDAGLQIVGRSANLLRVSVTPGLSAPVGDVLLVASGGGQTASINLQIVAPRPSVSTADTLLLWHLDEHGVDYQQNLRISDSGPQSINGLVEYYYVYTPGRFGGAISNAPVYADDDRGLLAFGNNSFTLNFWMKGESRYEHRIIGRGNMYNGEDDFYVELLSTGGVRAVLSNNSGQTWQTQVSPQGFDLYDDRWHLVTMTVERGAAAAQNRLTLYVDGEARGVTTAPDNFGAVRSIVDSRFRVGLGYPVLIDEVQIINRASTAAQILDAWLGRDSYSLLRAPRSVQTAKSAQAVEPAATTADDARTPRVSPSPTGREATAAPPELHGLKRGAGMIDRE